MLHRIFFIFKFNGNFYTWDDTASQRWPTYIGLKIENLQACLTYPVHAPFFCRWRGLECPLFYPLRGWNRDKHLAACHKEIGREISTIGSFTDNSSGF